MCVCVRTFSGLFWCQLRQRCRSRNISCDESHQSHKETHLSDLRWSELHEWTARWRAGFSESTLSVWKAPTVWKGYYIQSYPLGMLEVVVAEVQDGASEVFLHWVSESLTCCHCFFFFVPVWSSCRRLSIKWMTESKSLLSHCYV